MSEPLRYEDMVKANKRLTEPHKPDGRSVVDQIADFYGLSANTRATLQRAWDRNLDESSDNDSEFIKAARKLHQQLEAGILEFLDRQLR